MSKDIAYVLRGDNRLQIRMRRVSHVLYDFIAMKIWERNLVGRHINWCLLGVLDAREDFSGKTEL